MKNANKAKKEAERQDLTDAVNYVNNFKPKENNDNCDKYNDLW